MSNYINLLREKLKAHENSENAVAMAKYMKNKFEFFGVKTDLRRQVFRNFWKEETLPEFSEIEKTVEELFALPKRDFHYFAIELVGKYKKQWKVETIDLFEKMATLQSWWDSVDFIKSFCLTPYFSVFPEKRPIITQKWIDSGNIWLQRLSVICQLGKKTEIDVELLFNNIRQLSDSKEFFVQKGIGWALRDLAWKQPDLVRKFVEETNLKPLSKREALKNLRPK